MRMVELKVVSCPVCGREFEDVSQIRAEAHMLQHKVVRHRDHNVSQAEGGAPKPRRPTVSAAGSAAAPTEASPT